jgi:hypothetical protein
MELGRTLFVEESSRNAELSTCQEGRNAGSARSPRSPTHRAHEQNQAQRRFHCAVGADGLYGPRPGLPIRPVVVVLDNGPIHVSKAAIAALADRAHWLAVEWLPKYAPELNDIEPVWRDLKHIIWPTRPSPTPTTSTIRFTPLSPP